MIKDDDKTYDILTIQLCMPERIFMKITNSAKYVQGALVVWSEKEDQIKKNKKQRSKKNEKCYYCKKVTV